MIQGWPLIPVAIYPAFVMDALGVVWEAMRPKAPALPGDDGNPE